MGKIKWAFSAAALATTLIVGATLGSYDAEASCGFAVNVKNVGDVGFTVAKIETSGTVIDNAFKTQWTGIQLIGAGGTHQFNITVDSDCGKSKNIRVTMQDGKQCTRATAMPSGGTYSIEKKTDCF